MKSIINLRMLIAITVLLLLTVVSFVRGTQNARAGLAPAPTFTPSPLPSPDYEVNPADTDGVDGQQLDCPLPGIGCSGDWGESATNRSHIFYLPPSHTNGKLLVYFNGGDGYPNPDQPIYSFAASLGYHVIGLSYTTATDSARINACDDDSERLTCYEDFMREVLFGTDDCEHETCTGLDTNFHPNDGALNRLKQAIKWARDKKGDGWGEYITGAGEVDWTKVNVAGFSNGSSYASLMGTLFPNVGRVTLFSGPNDGDGNSSDTWTSASYIHFVAGTTDTHYYGLIHELNKAADNGNTSTLYKVTKGWREFGMGEPYHASAVHFDPVPGETPNFGSAHMLISTNPTTDYRAAHGSVVHGRECTEFDKNDCDKYEGDWIGYEPAWRCVLGVGDPELNTSPTADAGENQTLECTGGGGAMVTLDGSSSSDPECDVLNYTWTGPFGVVTGRKPTVFLPVGTTVVTLVVSDGGTSSTSSDTISVTVQDTQPPTITCPSDIVVEPACSSGAVVTYTTPVGTDACDETSTTRTAGLASGSIFPIGTTAVTFTATDAANNTASCSFNVRVLSAAEVVQDLINRVQALQPPLNGQQVQGLRSKLDAALIAIDSDQKNVACNKLKDFISQVQTYMRNGKLTSAQGQPLIDSATHVRNTLGCTALGCT